MPPSVARIGLIGAESTGKTTLAARLGTLLPACVASEALREFVERHGRTPRAEEQAGVMRAQMAAEDHAAASCAHDVVIGDPAPLMTAVYSQAYFDDDRLLDEAVADTLRYSLVVWCDPDMPWAPDDGHRDGPGHRDLVHGLLARVVHDRLEPEGLTVLVARGTLEERAELVRRAWQP